MRSYLWEILRQIFKFRPLLHTFVGLQSETPRPKVCCRTFAQQRWYEWDVCLKQDKVLCPTHLLSLFFGKKNDEIRMSREFTPEKEDSGCECICNVQYDQ